MPAIADAGLGGTAPLALTGANSGERQRLFWRAVVLLIAALVVAPLIVLLTRIGDADASLIEHLLEHVLPRVFGHTLLLTTLVAGATAALGAGLAGLISRYRFPGRDVFSWALLLPLALPAYVLAFVAVGLLDFAGPLQTALRALFGPDLRLPPVRSVGGAALVLSLSFYPYVYLLCRSAFDSQGQRAMEAARSLGLSRRQAFWRVALPMSRPWLAAGLLLPACQSPLLDGKEVVLSMKDGKPTAALKVGGLTLVEVQK